MFEERSAGEKSKKETEGQTFVTCCSSTTHKPVWTEDGSGVKLADGVILSGRHAELLIIPELASFFVYQKMLIACFYE